MSTNARDRLAENRPLKSLPPGELEALRGRADFVSLRHGDHVIIPDFGGG